MKKIYGTIVINKASDIKNGYISNLLPDYNKLLPRPKSGVLTGYFNATDLKVPNNKRLIK